MSIKKKKNTPYRNRRMIIAVAVAVATICIMAVGAMLYSMNTPKPVDPLAFANAELARQQALYDEALEHWTNRDFEDYRYALQFADSCILLIIVQNNIPTLENASGTDCANFITAAALQELKTVDNLMSMIQTQLEARECGYNGCRCDGYIVYETEYHPTLGYPLTMRRGLTGNIIPTPTVPPNIPTEQYFEYIVSHLEACTLVGVGANPKAILALEPLPSEE